VLCIKEYTLLRRIVHTAVKGDKNEVEQVESATTRVEEPGKSEKQKDERSDDSVREEDARNPRTSEV
jgi:hypothetical protein